MADKITQAREFFKTYLEKNNTTVGEHSAVSAMAEYLDEYGNEPADVDVTEFYEYKELQLTLEKSASAYESVISERKEQHEADIKQRDFNWSELQKANAKIVELTTELGNFSKTVNSEEPVSGSK